MCAELSRETKSFHVILLGGIFAAKPYRAIGFYGLLKASNGAFRRRVPFMRHKKVFEKRAHTPAIYGIIFIKNQCYEISESTNFSLMVADTMTHRII